MIPSEVTESFKGKSCLVTGGTGLIGRQVVDLLCTAGADVTIVSLDDIQVDDRADHLLADGGAGRFDDGDARGIAGAERIAFCRECQQKNSRGD